MKYYQKDPNAHLDYTVDWSAWLPEGDTITAATVTGSTGITIDDVTHTATTVTYWATGGTVDESYYVTCHITTAEGRIDDRTDVITVRER